MGELQRAVRTRPHPGEVRNANAVERWPGHLNHTRALELAEPCGCEAQPLPEDLAIVLSQSRCGPPDFPGCCTVLERGTGILMCAGDRLRNFDEEAARLQV